MTVKKRESLVDKLESSPTGQLEMAAARAAVSAVFLMNRAAEARGITQRELAERVGVTESRVSQVLNGDGNVRLSTLAKFLRALGYRLRLSATPAEHGVPPLPVQPPRRRLPSSDQAPPAYVSVFVGRAATPQGVGPTHEVRFSPVHPSDWLAESTEAVTWRIPSWEIVSEHSAAWHVPTETAVSDDAAEVERV